MDAAPVVTCTSCGRAWRSAAMAEGLRHVGACPRCGGELEFHATAPEPQTAERDTPALEGVEPHLALGIPKR